MPARQRAKRRTTKEMEAFRRHLISMARELFIEQGVEAVSIRKIAERAGCPPMTFYVYFRNKLELLRHIWDDVLMAAADAAEAAAARHDEPAAALEAYAGAWCGYWTANPDNYRMVFFYEDKLNAPDDTFYVDSSTIYQRFHVLNALVERGMAEGSFAPIDPELAAQSLLTLCVGLSHCVIGIPEYRWDPELTSSAIHQMVQGLVTPGATAQRAARRA